jgi:protein arginine N-methyltransferase 3
MLIRQMPSKAVAGPSFPFATLDLHRVKAEDLVFVKDFNVSLSEDTNSLDGWLIYFDTFFLTSRDTPLPDGARAENWSTTNGATGNAFTTGPQGKATHWQSGVMVIERSKSGAQQPLKKDSKIRGKITYRKAKENVRGLEVDLEWELDSEAKAGSTATKQTWLLK